MHCIKILCSIIKRQFNVIKHKTLNIKHHCTKNVIRYYKTSIQCCKICIVQKLKHCVRGTQCLSAVHLHVENPTNLLLRNVMAGRQAWHLLLHFKPSLKHLHLLVLHLCWPLQLHFIKPWPSQLDSNWTAVRNTSSFVLLMSDSEMSFSEQTSNWFLAYFPWSTPWRTPIL